MKQTHSPDQPRMHQDAPPRLFSFAKENRYKPTHAEVLLWEALKDKQLGQHKFRRQHPVGRFILDFYCHARRLAVELDGGYHDDPHQKAHDQLRTAELARLGIREIRFRNRDVFQDYWGVLEGIWEALESPQAP